MSNRVQKINKLVKNNLQRVHTIASFEEAPMYFKENLKNKRAQKLKQKNS